MQTISYLALNIEIDDKDRLRCKLYDKRLREYLNFLIVNFPFN